MSSLTKLRKISNRLIVYSTKKKLAKCGLVKIIVAMKFERVLRPGAT